SVSHVRPPGWMAHAMESASQMPTGKSTVRLHAYVPEPRWRPLPETRRANVGETSGKPGKHAAQDGGRTSRAPLRRKGRTGKGPVMGDGGPPGVRACACESLRARTRGRRQGASPFHAGGAGVKHPAPALNPS